MIRKSRDRERGAALVEFAVLAPLLILLVLGIVEFGWKFGQFNDVRHGAREGGRYAAVDGDGTGNAAIHTRVCQAMDGLSAGITQLRVELDVDPDGA
ncbi:MAG: TadE/TadG family type IV pilus assembly protein, partial [Halobacteriales archaeon]|nr:TadE/TadG family type IV pilus assembly protein [Halobacteriales archaeon]